MMDKRIDRITKRGNIHTTIPVNEFSVTDNGITISFDDFNSRRISYKMRVIRCNRDPETLERWLKLLSIGRQLSIGGYSNQINFDQTMFHMLKRCRKNIRKTKAIYLSRVNVSLSKEDLSEFIRKLCPLAKILHLTSCSGLIENMINSTVLGVRSWYRIVFDRSIKMNSINDEFLLNVVSNTERIYLFETENSITVAGIFTMLKKLSTENRIKDRVILLFTMRRGHLDIQSVERLMATELPGMKIECCNKENNIRTYAVTFGRNGDGGGLSFSIDLPP